MCRSGRAVVASDDPVAPPRLAERLLAALHDEHAGALFAFAVRLSGNRERAEEAVADALLRAWQHPEAVDGDRRSARAWLFTVVRNRLTDDWRRDAARPRTSTANALDWVASPDEVERAVETWGLVEAMGRLTKEHRDVLYHASYLGRSVAETATELDIPVGTVKSRTYYALRALRSVLEEMGYVR
jgi:RNA polymerase sigma-70 factor (ECF subfamily)